MVQSRDSKDRFIKGCTAWNEGVPNSTGDHRGEKNSYHKLTEEQKANFAKLGNIAGNKKMGENPELYAKKRREKMNKLIDEGYRPQDNALWGKYITAPKNKIKELDSNHLNKVLGIG